MTEMTPQEICNMLVIIAFIVFFFGFITKVFFKVAVMIALVCCLFAFGFGWLPEQLEKIKNGDLTVDEIVNSVSDSLDVDNLLNKANGVVNGVENIVSNIPMPIIE